MRRIVKPGIALLLVLTCGTGCWNLTEPDQLAFITAAGMDVTPDGRVEISSQIAIPSALNVEETEKSTRKSFLVVSAAGKNVMDAGRSMQAKLSRRLFYQHRQAILIGDRMARRGIADMLDMFVRNPKSELRSTVAVVKDGTAKELLDINPKFDPFSGVAILRVQATEGETPYYYRQFLAEALSEGSTPLVPAFRAENGSELAYAGAAVLDNSKDLKLAGYLDLNESFLANWIIGRQSELAVTSFVHRGQGNVTLRLQKLSSRIRVGLTKEGEPSIEVSLRGDGNIIENNSSLDPSKSGDRRTVEQELASVTQQSVRQLIGKVQRQYKTDVFGFGERIHRRYPGRWKTLKKDWNRNFSELQVSIRVTLHAKSSGQTGSAMKRFL